MTELYGAYYEAQRFKNLLPMEPSNTENQP